MIPSDSIPDRRIIIAALVILIIIVIAAFLITKSPVNTTTVPSGNKSTTISSSQNGIHNGTTNTTVNTSSFSTSIQNNQNQSSTVTSTISKGGSSTGKTSSTTTSTSISITTTTAGSPGVNTTNSSQNVNIYLGNTTGYIYCVGDAAIYPNNATYYAALSGLGVSNWTNTTSYPARLVNAGCSISGNYIYCVGSQVPASNNQKNSTAYFAPISNYGIGNWTQTTSYPIANFSQAGCSAYNNYLYCVGGGAYNSSNHSYYASLSSSGIGQWRPTTPYPTGLYDAGCSIYKGYIYCVGNSYFQSGSKFNASIAQRVEYAPVSSSGIGDWISTTPYPRWFFGAGCTTYNSTIYCVGNQGVPIGANDSLVFFAHILNNGGLGTWVQTTSYPANFSDAGCVAQAGYLYCTGGLDANATQSTYYAQINQNGVGAWNQTEDYLQPIFGAYCDVAGESGGFYSS